MIRVPTALVLGAGVSLSYGYPLGSGLVEDVLGNVDSEYWAQIIMHCGVDRREISRFKSELQLSQQASIDRFLEHRPELMRVGKLAIALALMLRERNDVLLTDFGIRKAGIYHYLYEKLNATWDSFNQNKLSIVTFNYDRSIEHFLFSALKHSYDKSDGETSEAIANIPIIHVHGWLGPLPWQAEGGRPYAPVLAPDSARAVIRNPKLRLPIAQSVQRASEQIIVVSQANPNTEEFQEAHALLEAAERIYFLGFGFHRDNLTRLQLKAGTLATRSDPSIQQNLMNPKYTLSPHRGSALDLGEAEREAIRNEWRIALPDSKLDALAFLKEYAHLD